MHYPDKNVSEISDVSRELVGRQLAYQNSISWGEAVLFRGQRCAMQVLIGARFV